MDFRQPLYPGMIPQTVTAAPIGTTVLSGLPVVRIQKEVSTNERKVTDLRALFIFCSVVALASYISFETMIYGNLTRLTHGVNYNGGVCGSGPRLGNHPFLYYPLDPQHGSVRLLSTARKCVQTCPTAADVKSQKVIPITRTQTDISPRGSYTTLLEYNINSPVYASTPYAGRLCVPIDSVLALQLTQELLTSPLFFLRSLIGSLYTATAPIFFSVITGFVWSILGSWIFRCFTKLLLPIFTAIAVVSAAVFGGFLLVAASQSTAGPGVMSKSLFEVTGSFMAGLGMITVAVGLPLVLFSRREIVRTSIRILEAAGDVLWSRGTLGSSTILSLVILCVGWFWIWILFLLCGTSTAALGTPMRLSESRNGGVSILPMEVQDKLPLWAALTIPIWLFIGCWISEFLFTLHKFSVCYAGTMYYFTSEGPLSEDEAFHGPPRIAPSFAALTIGLSNHTGSVAAAALAFMFVRPYQAVKCWIQPRYIYNDDGIGTGVEKLSNVITSNGFVEMAVASTSLRTSMKAAAMRICNPNSVAAQLIGMTQMSTCVAELAIVIFSGLLTFSILAKNPDYSQPSSKYFVPAPLFTTMASMIFAGAVAYPQIDSWAVLSDTLLYCYLLESGVEESAAGSLSLSDNSTIFIGNLAPPDNHVEVLSEPSKSKQTLATPFGINRFMLLIIVGIYATLIGSHFFNWTPWEKILIQSGAYRSQCEIAGEVCQAQQESIASLLPLVSLAMFTFTFFAGLCLDIIGPKTCCIFGNTLLIAGWILLSLSSPTNETYRIGFFLMGAGTDPAFFGYSSTVIAVLGAARSLSNLWPVLLYNITSKSFQFPQMSLVFVFTYAACLLLVVFLIPNRPYVLASADPEILRKMTVNNQLELAQIGAAPAQAEVVALTPQDVESSIMDSGGTPKNERENFFKRNLNLIKEQILSLVKHIGSAMYLPVVAITVINVIRNNFYLSSATKQLKSAEQVLAILNVLAFIPGPICGLMVDKYGPLSVITGINTTNLFVYVALVIGEFAPSVRDVLAYSSTFLAFPGIGFLLSQIYCYIAIVFPPEDMGKLAGFASFIAGVCGLVVDSMYRISLDIGKFWPMNSVNIATSGINYLLLFFLFWKGSQIKDVEIR